MTRTKSHELSFFQRYGTAMIALLVGLVVYRPVRWLIFGSNGQANLDLVDYLQLTISQFYTTETYVSAWIGLLAAPMVYTFMAESRETLPKWRLWSTERRDGSVWGLIVTITRKLKAYTIFGLITFAGLICVGVASAALDPVAPKSIFDSIAGVFSRLGELATAERWHELPILLACVVVGLMVAGASTAWIIHEEPIEA